MRAFSHTFRLGRTGATTTHGDDTSGYSSTSKKSGLKGSVSRTFSKMTSKFDSTSSSNAKLSKLSVCDTEDSRSQQKSGSDMPDSASEGKTSQFRSLFSSRKSTVYDPSEKYTPLKRANPPLGSIIGEYWCDGEPTASPPTSYATNTESRFTWIRNIPPIQSRKGARGSKPIFNPTSGTRNSIFTSQPPTTAKTCTSMVLYRPPTVLQASDFSSPPPPHSVAPESNLRPANSHWSSYLPPISYKTLGISAAVLTLGALAYYATGTSSAVASSNPPGSAYSMSNLANMSSGIGGNSRLSASAQGSGMFGWR